MERWRKILYGIILSDLEMNNEACFWLAVYRNCWLLRGLHWPQHTLSGGRTSWAHLRLSLRPKDRANDLALSVLSEFISLKVGRPLSLVEHPQPTHAVSQITPSRPCNCSAGWVQSSFQTLCLLTILNCKHIFLYHAPTQANRRQKHMIALNVRASRC